MTNRPGAASEFPNEPAAVAAAGKFVSDVLYPVGLDDVVPRIVTSWPGLQVP